MSSTNDKLTPISAYFQYDHGFMIHSLKKSVQNEIDPTQSRYSRESHILSGDFYSKLVNWMRCQNESSNENIILVRKNKNKTKQK